MSIDQPFTSNLAAIHKHKPAAHEQTPRGNFSLLLDCDSIPRMEKA